MKGQEPLRILAIEDGEMTLNRYGVLFAAIAVQQSVQTAYHA